MKTQTVVVYVNNGIVLDVFPTWHGALVYLNALYEVDSEDTSPRFYTTGKSGEDNGHGNQNWFQFDEDGKCITNIQLREFSLNTIWEKR